MQYIVVTRCAKAGQAGEFAVKVRLGQQWELLPELVPRGEPGVRDGSGWSVVVVVVF